MKVGAGPPQTTSSRHNSLIYRLIGQCREKISIPIASKKPKAGLVFCNGKMIKNLLTLKGSELQDFCFCTVFCYLPYVGLEFSILLPQPPESQCLALCIETVYLCLCSSKASQTVGKEISMSVSQCNFTKSVIGSNWAL